ncbi:oligosaccharide flippase family protein [uncultured Veillonella sp.]|uniref:oligosaccharide flippase family protein n=1 Tax=uncultured Veillonella sp. TaxID=159268 RepID=UPI0025FFAFA7|nr:oligosaccharide flippase family protein [uncultured Veillonella sp.]MDY3973342.1 oligosaccharide flippase family protein [Veillonella caviae]
MKLQNKNAIYNILGPIILNGINFFTIPIFTRMMGPSQYGIVSVFTTWIGIFSIILGLQVQGSIGTAKAHLGDECIKKYLSSILILGLTFSTLCLSVGAIFYKPISDWMMLSVETYILMGVQSIATFVISFSSIAFIFYKKAQYSFFVNVSTAVITSVLSVVLIMYHFHAAEAYLGRIYGMVIPTACISLFVAFYFLKEGNFTFKKEYVTFCLPICLPLIFHGLSHIILGQSDRIILQRFLGNEATGIYSFMIIFSGVLTAIWGALNNTWVPFYYDDLRAGLLEVIREKSKNYILIFTIIHIVFLMWAPEVIKIFTPPPFWQSIYLLPLFVLSNYFTFMYSFPVNFQFYHKTTISIAIGTVGAALVNIGLNFVFIPMFGIVGSALATLIAHIMLFVFQQIISSYIIKYPYHYNWRFFVPGILIMTIVTVGFYSLESLILIRWGIGVLFSIYFFFDIYRRKKLF